MSNILRVTTPPTGYDNPNNVKTGPSAPKEPRIQAPVIPDKVVRTDGRSDSAAQENNVGLKYTYESNFDNFINQMAQTPGMMDEFTMVLFERLGILAESGISPEFAEEISQFMDMIRLSPDEMLAFLKNQGDASVRYKGAFFNILRQVMHESSSMELKAGILEFLKRYTDMAEGRHIMENIRMELAIIKARMFPNAKGQLQQMEEQLTYGAEAGKGNTNGNAEILKDRILPFLNEYVSKTHDRGVLRETAAILSAQVARYENGELGKMIDAFVRLLDYQDMQKYFSGLDIDHLSQILENTDYEKAAGKNDAMDKLASLIQRGVSGEAGLESKQVFRNLMNAILLNESVYMPVLHMMLPLEVDGRVMFSEMWIDPDAEENQSMVSGERVIKGLIKFDIKDVGYFDLFFLYSKEQVKLQLHYPEKLKTEQKSIQNQIGQILAQNGMKAEELVLEASDKSIPISEAFPKIYERKNTINVSV